MQSLSRCSGNLVFSTFKTLNKIPKTQLLNIFTDRLDQSNVDNDNSDLFASQKQARFFSNGFTSEATEKAQAAIVDPSQMKPVQLAQFKDRVMAPWNLAVRGISFYPLAFQKLGVNQSVIDEFKSILSDMCENRQYPPQARLMLEKGFSYTHETAIPTPISLASKDHVFSWPYVSWSIRGLIHNLVFAHVQDSEISKLSCSVYKMAEQSNHPELCNLIKKNGIFKFEIKYQPDLDNVKISTGNAEDLMEKIKSELRHDFDKRYEKTLAEYLANKTLTPQELIEGLDQSIKNYIKTPGSLFWLLQNNDAIPHTICAFSDDPKMQGHLMCLWTNVQINAHYNGDASMGSPGYKWHLK